jgi:hypothetical protein
MKMGINSARAWLTSPQPFALRAAATSKLLWVSLNAQAVYAVPAALLMGASCVPPSAGFSRAAASASSCQRSQMLFYASLHARITGQPLGANVIAPGPPAKPFDGLSRSRQLSTLTRMPHRCGLLRSSLGERRGAARGCTGGAEPSPPPRFPNSVCGVVYQGSTRRTGCQFSFTCDGSMAAGSNQWAWAEARKVAESALSGHVSANVGLATHYHTTAVSPWWAPSLTRAVTVGSHIFYRWRGIWGSRCIPPTICGGRSRSS